MTATIHTIIDAMAWAAHNAVPTLKAMAEAVSIGDHVEVGRLMNHITHMYESVTKTAA